MPDKKRNGAVTMNKIILFGSPDNAALTLPLCRSLSENGGALYLKSGCISEYSHVSPEFAVFETDRLDICNADKTILIFKNDAAVFQPSFAPCDKLAVVSESGNHAAARFAAKNGLPLTTYGMGSGSCVSASSIGEKQAVVSVHRIIELLSGRTLEPCEFTVRYEQRPDNYILLPICLVMILCEKYKDSIIKV